MTRASHNDLFRDLVESLGESIRAAVQSIPKILGAAEHAAWCEFHEGRGWQKTKTQKGKKNNYSDPPRHPLLVSWRALAKESDRKKDRDQVRHCVEIVYDLYRHKDDPVPDPKVGVRAGAH